MRTAPPIQVLSQAQLQGTTPYRPDPDQENPDTVLPSPPSPKAGRMEVVEKRSKSTPMTYAYGYFPDRGGFQQTAGWAGMRFKRSVAATAPSMREGPMAFRQKMLVPQTIKSTIGVV